MRVSKREFDSIWFQNMLREVGDGDKTAILSRHNLGIFVKAEFGVFLLFLKIIAKKKTEEAKGNAYAQGLHDGGTLTNKKKFQALAIQFVAPDWARNLVITIGFKRSAMNKDKDVAALWRDTVKERCGFEFEEIVGRMRADRAAKGVAGELDLDEVEVCEMHDADKLVKSALGGLVRTKNKKAENPFTEGAELVQRAHKLGTHFGYSSRHDDLVKVAKELGNCPEITIKVDYNTTRIAAVHGLLHSELRMNKPLKAYELKHSPGWEFGSTRFSTDWQVASEFEAVANCTRITSTLAQTEKHYMAAYTLLIKQMAMCKLKGPLQA